MNRGRTLLRRRIAEHLQGYLFVSPVLLGILLFTAWPMAQSLYNSFTEFNVLKPAKWVGWANYEKLFASGEFWHSLKITMTYMLLTVPLGLAAGFLMSLVLIRQMPGVGIVRTIFYLPVIVPVVAMGILWKQVYSKEFGLANQFLQSIGLEPYTWFSHPDSVMPSLVLMALWQSGGAMIIWLAGLQGVPKHLYEAAFVDGAKRFRSFWHITLPMVTPVIFFNMVMGLIAALQVFAQVQVTTQGGPLNASSFLMVIIYKYAFVSSQMGYASALSWVMFLVILLFTVLVFRTSRSWVHYEEDGKA